MPKISIVSSDYIAKHPANYSPSRFVNSFSRSKRFQPLTTHCKEAFYSKGSQLSKGKVTIGNSKRLDFTSSTILSPASSTYNIPSQFTKLSRSLSFGLSRNQCPERSYLYDFEKRIVPGPGAYENQIRTRMLVSYTLRSKTLDVNAKRLTYLAVPGPGSYQSVELNPQNGRFELSKYSDSKLSVINKAARFQKQKKKQPGPATYSKIDDLNSKGKYVLSHRRGKGTRPFDKEMKFTVSYWKPKDNPGPGAYQKPSDFGLYGDHQYNKALRSTS